MSQGAGRSTGDPWGSPGGVADPPFSATDQAEVSIERVETFPVGTGATVIFRLNSVAESFDPDKQVRISLHAVRLGTGEMHDLGFAFMSPGETERLRVSVSELTRSPGQWSIYPAVRSAPPGAGSGSVNRQIAGDGYTIMVGSGRARGDGDDEATPGERPRPQDDSDGLAGELLLLSGALAVARLEGWL